MNINENKNATEHSANLEKFFSRKMEIDKINRKIKRHEKVSKKKQENRLSFDFDSKQFRLVDKNNVASVSVSRIGKKNTEEMLKKYEKSVQKSRKKILKNKYELLFEYQNIENFDSIYKSIIQPHESSIKINEKTIEDYNNDEKEKMKELGDSRLRILEQQNLYESDLKSNKSGDKNINKREYMKGYIEHQNELYELHRNNVIDSFNIDEKEIKNV